LQEPPVYSTTLEELLGRELLELPGRELELLKEDELTGREELDDRR